jgi:hypothetical protein
MVHPLWWKDGSVVYSCWWDSPEQSFLGSSSLGLMTDFYCLKFETPPSVDAQVPIFIYPRNMAAQL